MSDQPKKPPEPAAGNGATDQQGAAVLEDLEALRTRVAEAERDRDKYLDLLQRTRADFENYQKRIQRDMQQERKYAALPLAQELLPALDNLERALVAAKQTGDGNALVQGVNIVYSQLLDALKRQGITRIDALNQPFDPTLHQAVMQQASPDHGPGMVLQVLQEGYMLHDRVLRPASVVVSA